MTPEQTRRINQNPPKLSFCRPVYQPAQLCRSDSLGLEWLEVGIIMFQTACISSPEICCLRLWGSQNMSCLAQSRSTLKKKKSKLPEKNIFFPHISSSYAKILGETNFHTWEIPRSGSKAKDGEKKIIRKILQGLRVAQAAVTERWP